jgi:cytochrome c peroxidase
MRIAIVLLAAVLTVEVNGASSNAPPPSSQIYLRTECPPSFELVAGHACQFRSLYQMYSSPPGAGGLRANLPPLPDGFSPEVIDLGRYLFFDPILSATHRLSCAHCHNPRSALADGQAFTTDGVRQTERRARPPCLAVPVRRAPTLWNVGFLHNLFWDGRAHSLEEQAKGPLFACSEMANSSKDLERDLNGQPIYRRLFREAFALPEGQRITTAQVIRALAAFETTLISLNSRYDRYAHGDEAALSEPEKHGLNILRSTTLACSQCHTPPLFTNDELEVTGVPNVPGLPFDPGAAGVSGTRNFTGAFRTPTLRNVALKGAYMHGGQFLTLADAVRFYNDRAGHAAPRGEHLQIDWRMILRRPVLTEGDVKDIVAFLRTLTDESMMPEVPSDVPSGLPVLPKEETRGKARG